MYRTSHEGSNHEGTRGDGIESNDDHEDKYVTVVCCEDNNDDTISHTLQRSYS